MRDEKAEVTTTKTFTFDPVEKRYLCEAVSSEIARLAEQIKQDLLEGKTITDSILEQVNRRQKLLKKLAN